MAPLRPDPAARPRAAAWVLVAALVVAAGSGCGSDDEGGVGGTVAGRAPTSTAETSASSSGSTTGPSSTGGTVTDDMPAGAQPLAEVEVSLTEVARLAAPVKLVGRPGHPDLHVALKEGRVVRVDPEGGDPTTVLDVSEVTTDQGEQGLLGLAFSTDGETLYVHHSGLEGETRVAAFTMDGDRADPTSRVDLLTVDQPFPNHNGGDIVVGPDGHLWIGLGDGGAAGDPGNRAQDPDDLLGKVLRIDPTRAEGDRPYAIPEDNPFAAGGGAPEIAVLGVRNPWRLRFDDATGDLLIADVGQNAWEEIDHLPAGSILGANLGWSRFEASAEFDDGRTTDVGRLVGPVFEMSHADGWCSVTGGTVYRGDAVPELAGAYLFGDNCKSDVAALRLGPDGTVAETIVLAEGPSALVSIDADADGELYLLSLEGEVLRLDPA